MDKIFKQTIREGKGIPDYNGSTDFCVKLVIDAVVRYLRELKEGGKIELIGNPKIVKGDRKAFWRLKQ